jgi:hypothetical protein
MEVMSRQAMFDGVLNEILTHKPENNILIGISSWSGGLTASFIPVPVHKSGKLSTKQQSKQNGSRGSFQNAVLVLIIQYSVW